MSETTKASTTPTMDRACHDCGAQATHVKLWTSRDPSPTLNGTTLYAYRCESCAEGERAAGARVESIANGRPLSFWRWEERLSGGHHGE